MTKYLKQNFFSESRTFNEPCIFAKYLQINEIILRNNHYIQRDFSYLDVQEIYDFSVQLVFHGHSSVSLATATIANGTTITLKSVIVENCVTNKTLMCSYITGLDSNTTYHTFVSIRFFKSRKNV